MAQLVKCFQTIAWTCLQNPNKMAVACAHIPGSQDAEAAGSDSPASLLSSSSSEERPHHIN